MKLIIEYHIPPNPHRKNEYDQCLKHNVGNPLIDEIVVFVENPNIKLTISNPKLKMIVVEERQTYQDLFQYCSGTYPEDTICIISNTDMMFNETLGYITKDNIDGRFFALTRWDIVVKDNKPVLKFFNQSGISKFSQDCWIFKTPINIQGANYTMGKPGCDNRLVHEAKESNLIPTNPSMKIITQHLHLTQFRTYTQKHAVGPPYLGIIPTDDININSQQIYLQK